MSQRIPDIAHFELMNWSRFCWEGPYPHPLPPTHCYSFEHNYIAPSDMGNDDKPVSRIFANAHNAMRVQNVFIMLPTTQRLVIRAEYPKRHESGRAEFGMVGASRRLHMKLSEYEYALSAVVSKVMEEFA